MNRPAPRPPGARPDPLAALGRRRVLARLALAWEAIWPAIWPGLGVLGLYLTIALLGLPLLLPGWARLALAAGFAAALAFALHRGLRGLRWPGEAPADRRLEQASGLLHRPLAALADRPAASDPVALAVWQVHRDRALASVTRLRVGLPRPGLARRDPIALRAALGLSLLAALVIAGPEAPERLRRAILPPTTIAAQTYLRLGALIQVRVTPSRRQSSRMPSAFAVETICVSAFLRSPTDHVQ